MSLIARAAFGYASASSRVNCAWASANFATQSAPRSPARFWVSATRLSMFSYVPSEVSPPSRAVSMIRSFRSRMRSIVALIGPDPFDPERLELDRPPRARLEPERLELDLLDDLPLPLRVVCCATTLLPSLYLSRTRSGARKPLAAEGLEVV